MPETASNPEWRLLCQVVAQATGDATPVDTSSALDWPALVELARWHGVLPLLHQWLEKNPNLPCPATVRTLLAGEQQQTLMHNLLLAGELAALIDDARTAGYSALTFKGPTLAIEAYGSLGARQNADLDLLVPTSETGWWRERLTGLHYQLLPRPACEEDDANSLNFSHNARPILIDLHWRVFQKRYGIPLAYEDFTPISTQLDYDGVAIPVPTPEQTLVILCAHGAKHYWKRLAWLADLAGFVQRHPQLDKQRCLDWAKRVGQLRAVWVGLWLAKKTLGLPLAAKWIPAGEQERVRRVAAPVLHWDSRHSEGARQRYEHLRFLLQTRDNWSGRRHVLAFHVAEALRPTGRDRAFVRLPSALSWAYWLVRPVRLLTDFLRPRGAVRAKSHPQA